MKEKKLLIATDNFLPRWDGIARFLSEIIPKLEKEYKITVLAPDFGKFKAENYKLIQLKLSRFSAGDYQAASLNRKKIREEVKKTDIVFAQTIGPIGAQSIVFGKKMKKPVISFIHSLEWELVPMAARNMWLRRALFPFMKFFSRYIYRKPDLLVVPSENISEKMTWEHIHTKKEVVHLGVDCETFKPLSERNEKEKTKVEELRKNLGLEETYVIGNHGRIAREKDIYTLMRAFQRFVKKHPNSKLLIVGNGIPEIREKLSSVPGIIVLEAKDDVQYYLNLMDAYVTSSLTETTSLTTLEAMASSLPVVSTPVGFIKEYIKENHNGLLYPQKNAYNLFKHLDLLKSNLSLAKIMGNRARKTVIEEFQWSNTSEGISKALKFIKE